MDLITIDGKILQKAAQKMDWGERFAKTWAKVSGRDSLDMPVTILDSRLLLLAIEAGRDIIIHRYENSASPTGWIVEVKVSGKVKVDGKEQEGIINRTRANPPARAKE